MRIYSIFTSINGEVCNKHQGSICTFIRFAGCSVGCPHCDTKYAMEPSSGKEMSIFEIITEVSKTNCKNVTITGGEPFDQRKDLIQLTDALLMTDFNVSIETSGELLFDRSEFNMGLSNKLSFVVDIKMASWSKHNEKKLSAVLKSQDFFKFVVHDENSLLDAIVMKAYLQEGKSCLATFAFSPRNGTLSPNQVLKSLLHWKQMDAILNVQMHKILDLQEDK